MALFPEHTLQTDFALCHKLIYSFPKTGKSTLAAQMVDAKGRKPLFVMTEDGLGSLRVSYVRTSTWDGFRRLVDDILVKRAQIEQEYSTIVLDVVGDLDQWCAAAVAAKYRVDHVSDMEGGKGWSLLRQQLAHEFGRLMSVAPVTFIAHSQEKEVLINGEKVKGQAPSLGKACFEYINGKVDAIMWISPTTSRKPTSTITMRPTSGAIAGSRQRAIAHDFVYDSANPSAAYAQICAEYKKAQLELIGGQPVTTNADAPAPVDTKE